jgi:S-adenosylmethionine-diacylglycerol 3-amino-3-carboxypropyl transferase
LFRGLKAFVHDFIWDEDSFNQLIFSDKSTFNITHHVFDNPYWPVAFKLFLHDELLITMFGKNAIQHSPKGSYPRYFQHAFERGLLSPGRQSNYFLHHVFLGYYRNEKTSLPPYLSSPYENQKDITLVHKTLDQIDFLSDYGFIQLSISLNKGSG